LHAYWHYSGYVKDMQKVIHSQLTLDEVDRRRKAAVKSEHPGGFKTIRSTG